MAGPEQLAVSIGTDYDKSLRLNPEDAEAESKACWEKNEYPKGITEVSEWLVKQVGSESAFYLQHKGSYVIGISLDPLVLEINPDMSAVVRGAYARWGYRPLCLVKLDLPQRFRGPQSTSYEKIVLFDF